MELNQELEYWNTLYYQAIHNPNTTEQQREELNRWRKECLKEVNESKDSNINQRFNGEEVQRTRPVV